MTGHVDAAGRAILQVTLRGPFGFEVVDAVIDTGFNGHLSFPLATAYRLGLVRHGIQYSELGDGRSSTEPTFIVEVEWVSGPRRCVGSGSSLHEYLIGTGLLEGHQLLIDFGPAKAVEVR